MTPDTDRLLTQTPGLAFETFDIPESDLCKDFAFPKPPPSNGVRPPPGGGEGRQVSLGFHQTVYPMDF